MMIKSCLVTMERKDKHEQRRVLYFLSFYFLTTQTWSKSQSLENRLKQVSQSWYLPPYLPAWSCSCPHQYNHHQQHHHEPEFANYTTAKYHWDIQQLSPFYSLTILLLEHLFHNLHSLLSLFIPRSEQSFLYFQVSSSPSLRPWSEWLGESVCGH